MAIKRNELQIAPGYLSRRHFVKRSAVAAGAILGAKRSLAESPSAGVAAENVKHGFPAVDSLCHGPEWETLNPGYWQIKGGALRRRLTNVGDRARRTGFPFHYYNQGTKMNTAYDPSLPVGVIYRRDWNMKGSFTISADFVYRADRPSVREGDDANWKMYQDGYGQLGLAFGAKSLFESFNKARNAIQVVWTDDAQLQFKFTGQRQKKVNAKPVEAMRLVRGEKLKMLVDCKVQGQDASLVATLQKENGENARISATVPSSWIQGFVGVCAQGLIDFEVKEFNVSPYENERLNVKNTECYACYPLGDTLKLVGEEWQVRFVSLFDTDGQKVEIRISEHENPVDGWLSVPVSGTAAIVNHRWRRNTAVIHASLPRNPAETTLFYTVWKDGQNVTADPRIDSHATGPGTGLVGDVPRSGEYVGRLPQLKAPYKLCGLSCHAITSGLQEKNAGGYAMRGGGDVWQFRDQPTRGAYAHLDDYDFQVMVWEDDVWYMELVMYPPSTDDAYKIIKHSICGPTSRWQMMRHWNVINPGDHDYGMDDVKGPEQLAIRRVEGLGQDAAYMRRNFQIVHHLVTGEEDVDPLANPKKWRAWKMPNRDFTFVILDSRLWRSSQDTDIWDDEGWDAFKNLYDRTDPTRSLLGEEQFGWLQRLIETDSSPLICLTGINGMHTVWTGQYWKEEAHLEGPFDQRDRVTADYAGWVKAGADRVLQLLGSRDGVVTVYGDVHNGCIMKNVDHGVIECSFGPIGRSGGRAVIPGFGRNMKDFDGRSIEVHALYHKTHANPDLNKHPEGEPFYWNFLEMEFDPWAAQDNIQFRVRNMIDPPDQEARGGGQLKVATHQTGRHMTSLAPEIRTLPNADVRFVTTEGKTVRATRSDPSGRARIAGFQDISAGESLVVTAHNGDQVQSQIVQTKGHPQ